MSTITIKKGDNLSSLAQQYGTTVGELVNANKGNVAVKSADLIIAGGQLNIPGKVTTPPAGPVAPSSQVSTGGMDAPIVQDVGAKTIGDLTNFRLSLREALNEAARKRVEDNFKAIAPLSSNVPGTIGSVVDLIRSSVKTPVETTFSDVLKVYEEQKKALEFSPDNYRSVQGGIYDLKNNNWIISPKDPSNSTNGKTLSRTDVEKLKLPISLVGTSWSMFQTQISNSMPPAWFRNVAEQNSKQSLTSDVLQSMWDQFREAFTSTFSGNDSSSLDYNNL